MKEKKKGKMETVDTMPIKRTRADEKMKEADNSQSQEEKAGPSKKKKGPRRRINIDDFQMGRYAEAYDLTADVSKQGPSITWPQLLHLSPKIRRQWSKIVSTRKGKVRPINLVGSKKLADVEPIVEAHIKGQRIGKAYVDGGAQICVMSSS